ncbi:MAG: hypothetical protein JO163_10500 [Methylobacteriaceae bacterium]|nr:hypothetical protein [Methylobacteriaceae bacterium]MBV9633391.1 hypothetical protein [Methylobacteriaceae bacterium]MBV9703148.1 hypothetical protein [Methylobacteriaceae bacterium]
MAGQVSPANFRFLFRQDRGTIDRSTWAAGTLILIGAFAVLLVTQAALNRTGYLAKVGLTGLFVMATMLLATCYYFLSAKRFRDRGRPAVLALALPAVGFVDAALHFLQPPTGGIFPLWLATLADVVLAAVTLWNLVELGFMPGEVPAPAGPND